MLKEFKHRHYQFNAKLISSRRLQRWYKQLLTLVIGANVKPNLFFALFDTGREVLAYFYVLSWECLFIFR